MMKPGQPGKNRRTPLGIGARTNFAGRLVINNGFGRGWLIHLRLNFSTVDRNNVVVADFLPEAGELAIGDLQGSGAAQPV